MITLQNERRRATRQIPLDLKHLEFLIKIANGEATARAYRLTRGDMIETYIILHNFYRNCFRLIALRYGLNNSRQTREHLLK